ncbi:MAG: bifunctional folylpolyglutamate synthase/dihydrofolate synthase [Flavobacteriales bacterium]|nr:bifunctional folylpolyglutamate synthase/dihydrofolate synthase [Flavobacteriales bacterium]
MNYQETLDWLFQQLASFQRVGQSAYKEDLTNIDALCDLLNHPQNKIKCIHVAGTNGKGSTCHLLASVLQEQGYKVGLYTSPHLKGFRERIKINGAMISEAEVVEFVKNHQADFTDISPSFFEMTTALAFAHFAHNKVDVAVIETGLGGRLDATNIIRPELSVITNVALDHQNILGDAVELIAKEKAGIIKTGVPVVFGSTTEEVLSVLKAEAQNKKSSYFLSSLEHSYTSALRGACQQENTATVCEAVRQMRALGWDISDEALESGLQNVLKNTQLRGRWEQISERPKVICDTGHNTHAIESIVKQLEEEPYQNLWMVIGMVGDKDVDAVLGLLPKHAKYVFCQPNIPRALSVEVLSEKAAQYLLLGTSIQNPKDALVKAQKLANEDDLIFVGGSTFVVAEIL